MNETLPETIACVEPGCRKTMYLKDGPYGQFYSHKEESAPKGYHTVNVDKLDQDALKPTKSSQDEARAAAHLGRSTAVRNASEDKPDWDAKDRQSVAQTAMKSASEVVAALIATKATTITYAEAEQDVKTMAESFYNEILRLKSKDSAEEEDITF